MIRYTHVKNCNLDYNITILILSCTLVINSLKSLVCHMLWILISEKYVEHALDGINIPHGQWTLLLVLSHKLIKSLMTPI
jgi:hypothetical protein